MKKIDILKINNLIKILVTLSIVFIFGFGSKAYILNNLGDKDLTGPDPYLFYRYVEQLYNKGFVDNPDCYRYLPVCGGVDKLLLPYIGFFNIKLIENFGLYNSFLHSLLKLFNITPVVTNTFDFGIHTTVPLLFGISSVIFFLLSYVIFRKNILYSLLVTLLFISTPILTYRIAIFEKEAAATPFILLSLLFYVLGISEQNYKKRLIFYGLSGAFMVISFMGWGGWTIIPLVIGISHLVYSIKNERLDYPFIIYIAPIILIGYIQYGKYFWKILFSTSSIVLLAPMVVIIVDFISRKLNIYEKIEKFSSLLSKKFHFNETATKRLIVLLITVIILSPILITKIKFIASNPWTERFASSVAEQQPSTPNQYLNMIRYPGIAMLILFFYITLSKNKIFLYRLLALLLSLLTVYIIVLSDFHILYSWLMFFLIIIYYILVVEKVDPAEIFLFSFILLTMVIGDYINRTLFFLGYSLPLIVGYTIKTLSEYLEEYINKLDKKKLREIIEDKIDIIISAILIVSSISGIYIFKNNSIVVFLIPILITLYFVFDFYLKNKNTKKIFPWIKNSIILIYLFGLPYIGVHGEIVFYDLSKTIFGTEKYLIDAMKWVEQNTPKDSLISFWWDYGYYAQTIGKRYTWLDGGNNYVYWNHLMGRYGLSMDENKAIELFYVHSTYNWYTFLVLELFNKNYIFWEKKIWKKLNLSESDVQALEDFINNNNRKWKKIVIDLLKGESIDNVSKNYNISDSIKDVLLKIKRNKYERPMYFMIHPSDIGKSYQFTKLGSNEYYDLHTWILPMYSTVIVGYNDVKSFSQLSQVIKNLRGGVYSITFAQNNTLYYYGEVPLDSDLIINGKEIPRCYPELGINNCGKINSVIIKFKEPIVKNNGLSMDLEYNKISPKNIENASVIILFQNNMYELPLKCVYYNGEVRVLNKDGYGGCLYITPSIQYSRLRESAFMSGYFITEKAMNMLWVKLYFFENSTYFEKVFDSHEYYGYKSTILSEMIYSPLKIWKIEKPKNITTDPYKYCIYIATNLKEINQCNEIFNKPKINSIWEV